MQTDNIEEVFDTNEESAQTSSIKADIVPCETCVNMFDFHKDIKDCMCDNCKVIIVDKVQLQETQKM